MPFGGNNQPVQWLNVATAIAFLDCSCWKKALCCSVALCAHGIALCAYSISLCVTLTNFQVTLQQ